MICATTDATIQDGAQHCCRGTPEGEPEVAEAGLPRHARQAATAAITMRGPAFMSRVFKLCLCPERRQNGLRIQVGPERTLECNINAQATFDRAAIESAIRDGAVLHSHHLPERCARHWRPRCVADAYTMSCTDIARTPNNLIYLCIHLCGDVDACRCYITFPCSPS